MNPHQISSNFAYDAETARGSLSAPAQGSAGPRSGAPTPCWSGERSRSPSTDRLYGLGGAPAQESAATSSCWACRGTGAIGEPDLYGNDDRCLRCEGTGVYPLPH